MMDLRNEGLRFRINGKERTESVLLLVPEAKVEFWTSIKGWKGVPVDVLPAARLDYILNYLAATRGTGRLMLYACDQKIEHLNGDFYGEGIDPSDNDPEHLFQIGSQGVVGVLAGQKGLIARYAADYPEINYLVKMNSKTNLVSTKQDDPYSPMLYTLESGLAMRGAGVNIVGIGYTIYLGSEYEATMMSEAGDLIAEAHAAGLIVVLWIYPRGKAVANEKDADLIAGAAGVALCLGADFVKVNPPKPVEIEIAPSQDIEGKGSKSIVKSSAELLARASEAAGRTGLVCAGGSNTDVSKFISQLWEQIHIGGACGNATGRNIHQRSLDEAVRLTRAIAAIDYADATPEESMAVFDGQLELVCGEDGWDVRNA
jgi:class I fructose-bisphosphate aldolase